MTHHDSGPLEDSGRDAASVKIPYVTLWQDAAGVIQIKLGNGIAPVNTVALLELAAFRYKAMLLPGISPQRVQAPAGSAPPHSEGGE